MRAPPRRRPPASKSRPAANKEPKRLALAARETSAAGLKQRFKSALAARRPLWVDAGSVEALSTADLQVVLAAAETARLGGLEFRIVAASAPFLNAFDELGLRETLDVRRGGTPR
jgi:anti-anti-sigma regulatory factor